MGVPREAVLRKGHLMSFEGPGAEEETLQATLTFGLGAGKYCACVSNAVIITANAHAKSTHYVPGSAANRHPLVYSPLAPCEVRAMI